MPANQEMKNLEFELKRLSADNKRSNIEALKRSSNAKEDRIQISGSGGTFKDEYASGSDIGGRVGYTKQLDKDSNITGGISAYKSRIKFGTPEGDKTIDKSGIDGVDLNYKKGNSSYGIDVRKEGKDNKVMFNYNKSFAKGGMVVAKSPIKANCGASVPPAQKAKK